MDQGYAALERAVERLLERHLELKEDHSRLLRQCEALQEENALLRQGKQVLDSRVRELKSGNDSLRQRQREAAERIGQLLIRIENSSSQSQDISGVAKPFSFDSAERIPREQLVQSTQAYPARDSAEGLGRNGIKGERLF